MSRDVITTREIATIAVLASLGGTLSTFVGYLGNIINLSLGIPFGAGQFLAGLHVFWIVLIRTLVPRNTAGTSGGLLKGLIELFTYRLKRYRQTAGMKDNQISRDFFT